MSIIVIKTQQELDALPDSFDNYTRIEIRATQRIAIKKARGNSSVVALENSSVVAWENSSVVARGNSSVVALENSSVVARGNSSVEAWENSSVVALENSSVVALENSSVVAWENSSVVARGNSSVEAWENSSVVARENSSVDLFLTATVFIYSTCAIVKKLLDNSHAVYKVKNGKRPLDIGPAVKITEFEDLITPTFDEWLSRGYVAADGITRNFISSKTIGQVTVYEVCDFKKEKSFVARNGEKFAHGKTVEQAIEDLRYKISDRDTSLYESWTMKTIASQDEMIEAYRKITGACAEGVKGFLKEISSPLIKDKMSVLDVATVTVGKFGNQDFLAFFKKEDL